MQLWRLDERWAGVERPYSAEDVVRLRGTVKVEYTLASWGRSGFGNCCTPSLMSGPLGPRRAPRRCKWCRPD